MDLELKGKIAVVTGGSRGIGRSIALALAGEGCDVALVATTAERAEAAAAEAGSLGGTARAYGCDVADGDSVKELSARILEDFGAVDILVNNAGITRDTLLLRMKDDDWQQVLDVNLKGAFNMCRAFAKTLMKRHGRIINISSVVGLAGNAGQVNYAASKGGLIAVTKSLAKELASRQVCVNAIAPGFVETEMTDGIDKGLRESMKDGIPLGRFGQPEDIASAVVFLSGKCAGYITGQTIVIDGGMVI